MNKSKYSKYNTSWRKVAKGEIIPFKKNMSVKNSITEKTGRFYPLKVALPLIGWKGNGKSFVKWLRSKDYLTRQGLPTEKIEKSNILRVVEDMEVDDMAGCTFITRGLQISSAGIGFFSSMVKLESL